MKRECELTAVVLLIGGLAGCAAAPGQRVSATGLANPASVYCIEQGGQLEIRRESAGEVGYCHLPDGRVIEEWALLRSAHPAAD